MPTIPLRRDGGQATVELVCLLPVIVTALVGAWQLVLAGHAAWSAAGAARAAARAEAVGGDAVRAARLSLPSSLDRRVAVATGRDGRVAVKVRVPAVVPGVALGTVTAHGSFAPQR